MKKILLLTPVLLLSFSCKQEEINGFDSLTAEEQQTIRERGTTSCKEKATPIFGKFKTESNKTFTSAGYSRGKVFTYEFKEGETVVKTVELKVWKQTADALYFIVSDSKASSDYFLRILKTDNEKIINDLFATYCSRPALYTSSIGSNGPLTVVNEYELPKAPNMELYKDTYSLAFNVPAFLGSYSLTRSLNVEDTDEQPVGSARNFTTTQKNESHAFASDDWSDANHYTQKFCSLNSSSDFRFSRQRNVEGFKIDLNSDDCLDAEPVGWNLDI